MNIKQYPSYQDTNIKWLKEIPSDWSISKVKHCFIRKNEKANQEDPVVLSLARDGVKVRDITTGEGQIAESYYHYNPVKPGDLLLNPMDLVSGANCSLSEVEGVISPAYINLKAKKGINPKYYDYFFKLQYWSMALFAHGKGVSFENRWTLNNETLMNYIIPLPDEDTQNAIVNFLNKKLAKINNIIEKDKKFIELLEERKTALINQTVTKGLDPDVPMKDSGIEWIGDIPEHWEKIKIKFFSDIFGRIGFRGYTAEDLVDEGEGAITLGPPNIDNQKLNLDEKKYLSWKKYEESPEIKIFNGDLLLVKTASVGKVALVKNLNEPTTINPQLAVFKNIKINKEYFYYAMISDSIQQQISSNLKGGVISTLTQEEIQNYIIPLPNISEQENIAIYLDNETTNIEKTIEKIQTNINLLEEYKTSLIHHVVTGKIDVRDEV